MRAGPLVATSYVGGVDSIVVIDPGTGAMVGSAPAPVSPHALAVAFGVAYIAGETEPSAYDLESCGRGTCTELWSSPVASAPSFGGALAVANGVVYRGYDDGVVEAYRAAGCGSVTCAPVTQVTDGPEVANLAVSNGHLVVGSDDEITVFDPAAPRG